jgi:phosphonate transport system permease protein
LPIVSTIRAEDLHVTFEERDQKVHALREISFTVEPGEVLAIIGRSGSGKSTLLRLLSGMLAPSRGSLEVAGFDPSEDHHPSPRFARAVGLVHQHYGLVPRISALRNVACGRLYDYDRHRALSGFRDDDLERAAELLDDLGLAGRADVPAGKLSGGERQRVAIARLLLQDPDVLLLDEPVSSLDIHWAERALDALLERRDDDRPPRTCVIVLHDLAQVREHADRVLLVDRGELVFDGDAETGCALLEDLEGDRSPVDAPTDGRAAAGGSIRPSSDDATGPDDRPGIGRRAFIALLVAGIVAIYLWSFFGVDIEGSRLFGSFDNARDFLGRLLPPDLSVTDTVAASIAETLQIAWLGTTFAALLALPISLLAARNTAPRPVRFPARVLLNLLRTVPSIIWGLFFVAIAGLGPLPGILALTFYATGYLGKFYYEGIESIDPGPIDALTGVGAGRLQRFRYGVLPQVAPLLLGYTLYMLEYNVRAASVLGVVGAGGVGYDLFNYINSFQYDRAATALLLLLALVTLIDAISSPLRAHLTGE